LKQQKELREFLTKKGINNLKEAESKLTNRELGEGEELEQVRQELAEKDQLKRDKGELEQETLSLTNKLKLKNQEATNKDKEIQRLKKEKSRSEIALNAKLTELKTKYSKQSKLLDEEQTDNNKLTEENEKLKEEINKLKEGG
jgi:hypothetical protein